MPRPLAAALICAGLALPAHAQEASPPAAGTPEAPPAQTQPEAPRSIRNAPNPRALEFTAYIFAASNVCGYRIGVPEFEELLAKQNVKPADVSARGAFGARVQTMFALMSNQMQLNRETACLAVAGEYGPEGTIAKNVLQPAGAAPEPAAPEPAPAR